MKINYGKTRSIALLTGSVLAASALMPMAPVQAADKSKTYKAGAAILGAAGAYMILKGKTVPGVVAGAGAYYAYKKGQKAKNNERYGRYPDDSYNNGNYSQYPDNNGNYSQYPDNNGNYPYVGSSTNGSYPNNGSANCPPGQGYDPGYQVPTNNNGAYPDYGYRAYNRGGKSQARRVVK